MPLAELEEGEQLCLVGSSLQTSDFELQTSTVLSSTLGRANTPVYNIEVHGQHVYQVGELGVLVHNTCIQPGTHAWDDAVSAIASATKGTKPNFTVRTASHAKKLLNDALGNMNRYKNYTHDATHYAKGYEVHNVMNARELAVHSLQHIKWFANKTSGHIFYYFPN